MIHYSAAGAYGYNASIGLNLFMISFSLPYARDPHFLLIALYK